MTAIQRLGRSDRLPEAVIADGLIFLSGMIPENPEADISNQ